MQSPYLVLEKLTGLTKSSIYNYDKKTYDKNSKLVNLENLRGYFANQLNVDKKPLFVSANKKPTFTSHPVHKDTPQNQSVFIHENYQEVIAFLTDLQKELQRNTGTISETQDLKVEKRAINQLIADISQKHDIPFDKAQKLFDKAKLLFPEEKLIYALPKGNSNNLILSHALERAYEMSKEAPEKLQRFVSIFSNRVNYKKPFLKFGKKTTLQELMAEYITIGCDLIDPHHWQIRANEKDARYRSGGVAAHQLTLCCFYHFYA